MVSGMFWPLSSTAFPVHPRPEILRKSKFNTPEDVAAFAQKFDEGTKRVFSNTEGVQYIKFGSPRDSDPKHGIKAGKLMLTGLPACSPQPVLPLTSLPLRREQVAGFFEPSIQSTVDFIRENFSEILSMNSVRSLGRTRIAHLKVHA